MTYGEPVTHLTGSLARTARAACLVIAATLALGASLPGGSASAASAPPVLAANPPELAAYYSQVLTWTGCEDGLTCAWLTVPLDYAKPSGSTIRTRVAKAVATGPATSRQGSVVINPGGPGGSGVEFTAYVAQAIAANVAEQFDIVGFDPRGVGQSAPITCLTGRQTTVWLAVDGSPNTSAEERRLMRLAGDIPKGCLQRSPALAHNVGTENTVRDMDILREVLGDTHLNWLGYSYGTYLGTLYAEDFPDRVGRMVLDGALDPSLDAMQVSEGQSRGFQKAITRFAADCAKRASCPWPTAKGVIAGVNTILAKLDARPMPTDSRRVLTQAEALTALFYPMYSTTLWPALRKALGMAASNDGTGMLAIADFANDRTGPNTYGSNQTSAFYAISCWDMPAPPGAEGLRAAASTWSAHAPVPELAISMAWGNAPCNKWFGHSARTPAAATSATTAPILVVGTTFDPATPYWWAVALSKQLKTSTLLTYRGDGHTAYGNGSSCIDKAVSGYLLTGSMPAAGTVCR